MSYKKRNLKFQFSLKEGAFDDKGNNILTLDNIKSTVAIDANGGVDGTSLEAMVWGLNMEKMALISYKGIQGNGAMKNMLKVWAEEEPIFVGSITNCIADMSQMPYAPLQISARAAGFEQSIKSSNFTADGATSAVDIITAIAKPLGYTVVNRGVTTMISDPHYSGDPISQIHACAHAAGIETDFRLGYIYIWPTGKFIDEVMPYVAPGNGLFGYPIFNGNGIKLSCEYSSQIQRGRKISIETSLPHATGEYAIQKTSHKLSSWVKDGQWTTTVDASLLDSLGVRN